MLNITSLLKRKINWQIGLLLLPLSFVTACAWQDEAYNPLAQSGKPTRGAQEIIDVNQPTMVEARPTHTIKAGENYYQIANQYGVNLRDLIEVNQLRPPFIPIIGQRLTIPNKKLYIVNSGDTLYSISRRFGVDLSALTRINNIAPPFIIYPGNQLVLPAEIAIAEMNNARASTAQINTASLPNTPINDDNDIIIENQQFKSPSSSENKSNIARQAQTSQMPSSQENLNENNDFAQEEGDIVILNIVEEREGRQSAQALNNSPNPIRSSQQAGSNASINQNLEYNQLGDITISPLQSLPPSPTPKIEQQTASQAQTSTQSRADASSNMSDANANAHANAPDKPVSNPEAIEVITVALAPSIAQNKDTPPAPSLPDADKRLRMSAQGLPLPPIRPADELTTIRMNAMVAQNIIPPPLSGRGFAWPIKGRVISKYGSLQRGLNNDGVNIAAPHGTSIRAAQNGVVAYSGSELKGFGNLILIRHDEGFVTAYAHNADSLVRLGQRVSKGETIARVGATGNVDTPQLHFQIRKNNETINPISQLQG